LGHKLLELTPVQETALVDLCESYWRNPRGGDSFQRLCEVKDMPEVNH
jgi:ribosomal protein L32E